MLATDLLRADLATDSILRFDGETGAPLGAFVTSGSGGLVDPHNPTFGPDGNLYVFSMQPGAQKILKYSGTTGAFQGTFVDTGSGGFAGGFGMDFSPNGDLFVATGGASVLRYNGTTGAFVGIAASGNGITRASGVDFGPDGNLYVLDSDSFTDTGYDRILRFNPTTGSFIDVFVQAGSLEDSITLTFGSDGQIYVPDFKLQQTLVFNGTTGKLQSVFQTSSPATGSFVFQVVFGPDGNAYYPTTQGVLRYEGETGRFIDEFVDADGGSIVYFPGTPSTDLAVTNVQIPVGGVQGGEIEVSYSVVNNSTAATAADSWDDVLYLSTDDVFDSSDREIARVTHTGSLAGGASYSETLTIPLLNVSLGNYHVIVAADRRGEVTDPNRVNNLHMSSSTLEVFPTLATSHDAEHSITVGRTLSAYTTVDLVGNQLTLTYNVYNLTDGYARDVSLRTMLATGVSFQNSTAQVTQNGQELTWNLGTLTPFRHASVSVTVALAQGVTQIDLGAQAFATIDTVAMVDDLGSAVLRTDAIDPALLAATLDANSADPFILAKAAELDQDAAKILQYLTQEVGFESYVGSLRGARGTMWSSAGNALDEASLGVALLRASGIPARYVQGTLSDPLAQELILSMFPEPFQVVGSVPDGAAVSDPANDPKLLSETRSHYWIQYDTGAGFVNADTTFADALPGETFTASTGSFAEVAETLRHKVTVRLNAEKYLAANALFGGGGLSQQTVLQQTFSAVELVGRPLSIGFQVSESTLPNPIFAYQAITYSPYFIVAGDTYDARNEPLIHGTPFQEVLTSFPLGSEVLTGMFADMEVTAPGGSTQTYQSTILDRIGIGARQGGATVSISPDAGPALTPLHVTTINFLPGKDDPTRHRRARADMEVLRAELEALNQQALEGSAAVSLGHPLITVSLIASSRLRLAHFLALSDGTVYDMARDLGVTAYYDSPRISIIRMSGSTSFSDVTQALDLRNNVLRVVVNPGQNVDARLLYELVRGELDTFLEAAVFGSQSDPKSALELNGVVSAHRIFEAAAQQNIPLILLQPGETQRLDGLALDPNAEALITLALGNGRLVVVPQQPVLVDGALHVAWFETDPLTGETIGVLEDGGHQAITTYAGAISLGFKAGIAFNIIAESANILLSSLHQKNAGDILAAIISAGGPLGTAASTTFAPGLLPIFGVSAYIGFVIGSFLSNKVKEFLKSLGIPDPEVSPYLMSPPTADLKPTNREVVTVLKPATLPTGALNVRGSVSSVNANQNTPVVFDINVQTGLTDNYNVVAEVPLGWTVGLSETGTVTAMPAAGLQADSYTIHLFARSVIDPGLLAHGEVTVNVAAAAPALDLTVVPDDLFFVSVDGGQLPSVFRASFHNFGPTQELIDVSFANLPAGFEAVATRNQVTVPAGATGIVGFHLQPTAPLPPPGTVLNFDVTVNNAGDTLSQTRTVSFTMPVVHGVRLRSTPPELSTTPGISVQAVLTVEARGNIPETVSLAVEPSTGLTVAGLENVSLTVGETKVLTLTLTPAANVPLNSLLVATITATFDGREPVMLFIPVHVAAPGVESVMRAATASLEIGNRDLANRLTDLGIALTNLTQQPLSEVFKVQAVASLDSILSLLANDPILALFVPELTSARDELAAAATEAEVLSALNNVGGALDEFSATVVNLARHQPQFVMLSAPQTVQPGTPTTFTALLRNIGTETTTYNLALGTLPAGVVGQITSPLQVTLAPGAFANVTASITPPTSEVFPFEFQILATANGFPAIVQSAVGTLTARSEFVSVVSVISDPPFADPGGLVSVSTRLLNAVNRQQSAMVQFQVFDAANVVVFTSASYPAELNVETSIETVSLGTVSTSGFPLGQYRVEVTVRDALSVPIPGASGQTTLLVGSPVVANMEVGPQALPPGTSTVTNTLTIGNQAVLLESLNLVGQAAAAGSTDVIRNGDFVYVATPSGIRVYNIAGANLTNPQFVRSVGAGAFVLKTRGNLLVSVRGAGSLGQITIVDTFSLTDPSNPQFLGTTGNIPYGSPASVVLTDTHALITVVNFLFTLPARDIVSQNGGLFAVNIANPAAPFFDGDAISAAGTPAGRDGIDDGVLFNANGTSSDGVGVLLGIDQSAGLQNIWDVVQVSPTILLLAGSSATGTNTQTGVGLIRVVDISNPRSPQLLRDVQVPGTVHAFGIDVQGDIAVITATEGGITEFNPTFPFAGHIVLAAVNLADPANPVVVSPQQLDLLAADGITFDAALGNGLFAFGGGDGSQPRLVLVDANNPSRLITGGFNVPAAIANISGGDNLVFTADRSSLIIYEIVAAPAIPVTAQVQIPKGTGVQIVPGSFNVPPTQIIPGTDFDTLVWDLSLTSAAPAQTLTWQTVVTGMRPGETRETTLGTSVSFTVQGTPGEVTLPAEHVFAEQILGLTPNAQTVPPGESAVYLVRVENPSSLSVTYDLEVLGLPADWGEIDPTVFVDANSFAFVPVTLTSNAFADLMSYGFTVTATVDGVASSVQGTLVLEGVAELPVEKPDAHGVVAAITPQSTTAGQGTPAQYTVRVTNPGSVTDAYVLFVTGLPAGFTAQFGQSFVSLAPGAGNYRDVPLLITPPPGTAPGDYPFTVTAAGFNDALIVDDASADLHVLGLGVAVDILPALVAPNSVFQVNVTNNGQTTDTFDLALGGPAGIIATLGLNSVTLAPGASQLVLITLGEIEFAVPGDMTLSAIATSRTNGAVQATDATLVGIDERFGLAALFNEHEAVLEEPGVAKFLLNIDNLGNVEDSYTVEIVATSGLVNAALVTFNNSFAASIPAVNLPGLASGVLQLNVDLMGGFGSVTVRVRSALSDTLVVEDTVIVRTAATPTIDFGDAPNSYGTLLESNSARHNSSGPQLGLLRDSEVDGQPTAAALGDDLDGEVDDEDGVILPGLFVAGTCDCTGTGLGNQIIVNASGVGYLDAWIDFNRNGRFDANEKIANSVPLLAGANAINVSVPANASAGLSYARFRINSTGGLGPTGPADDGEVEDYAVQIFNPSHGTAGIIADPNNAGANVLYIKGTLFSDAIVVRQTSPGIVTVYVAPFGSISSFSLASFQKIVVCGLVGADSISIESPISTPSVLYGDEGPDSISGGDGPDIIFGGLGVDALAGNGGDDMISGGGDTNDSLVGGAGFDRLWETGSGQFTLTSTQIKIGNDTNFISQFEAATLVGGNASDSFNISGWPFPVTIEGGGGTNTIVDSGNGNFTLTTSTLTRTIGAATRIATFTNIQNANLTGGTGNNSFNLTAWPYAATLSGAAGTDSFTVSGDVNYTLSDAMLLRPNLGMIRLNGFENATLTAGASDNTFTVSGWTKAATLNGAGGTDKLISTVNVNQTLSTSSLTRTGRGTLTLSSIENAELTGGVGNNTISAANFSGQVKLDGGGGNDTLTSGAGLALLLGGAGNDTLRAGTGRAVMIGGAGLDRVTGGSNDDLLISGQTAHDANAAALALILAEWASAASYADRVAHLTGTPGGLNGSVRLDGANVLHDTAVDILLGGLGNDLFFAKLTNPAKDTLGDKAASETAL